MAFDQAAHRRRFLQFLAASPLLAAGTGAAMAETCCPGRGSPIRCHGRRPIRPT